MTLYGLNFKTKYPDLFKVAKAIKQGGEQKVVVRKEKIIYTVASPSGDIEIEGEDILNLYQQAEAEYNDRGEKEIKYAENASKGVDEILQGLHQMEAARAIGSMGSVTKALVDIVKGSQKLANLE
ncbi:MAG: hypothetical protein GTN40_04960 [Candidatus Aenigmarchaeota archaeon]|nr:hypothetical protein [Candidatus Aenigmarchaeota archaeon]NIO45056.1 hypothetical protein [Candidatus Aenigmarchaeota archaeon]